MHIYLVLLSLQRYFLLRQNIVFCLSGFTPIHSLELNFLFLKFKQLIFLQDAQVFKGRMSYHQGKISVTAVRCS